MKITIHGLDYTSTLDMAQPLQIERKLNQLSECRFLLALCTDGSLEVPARNQLIAISGDDGTLYFTGYIAANPLPEYIGVGLDGPLYGLQIVALSDEVLLDQLPMPASAGITGETVGSLMGAFMTHSGSRSLAASGVEMDSMVGNVVPKPGADWSECASAAASAAGVTYRALDGTLALVPMQSVVHPLNETDSNFNPANLALMASVNRLPVNDVTLCGEREPVAYVTEYFNGDGVTSSFYLAEAPYIPPASTSKLIRELFDESEIDTRVWAITGGPGYFTLAGGGLNMLGGNGVDGQTVLSWLDSVEMGGTLLLEAAGITLKSGSAGILAGLFEGGSDLSSCTVGFQVTAQQSTGSLHLQPVVQGVPAGTVLSVNPSNQYTLRLRVHSSECNRALATYHAFSDDGVVSAGGDWTLSPGNLQLEAQEFVNGVGGMPVTLYDGVIATLPGTCTVVAASSVNLVGSMRAFHLSNLGSGWVASKPPNGGAFTRRLGSPVEAGECQLLSGRLQFQTGDVPVVGELVSVSYRMSGRAIGRAVNVGNQSSLAKAGMPSVASWSGSVLEPPARCSADCRSAARVTAQTAAEDRSVLRGIYRGTNCEFSADVWPGDALLLNAPSANLDSKVVIREVKISYRASLPDLVEYEISFANDWAEDLAIKRSPTVPTDAWLPAPASPTVLPNVSGLTVTALNGTTVGINTGISPPAGGGFEVRRRDFEFMPGMDPGLVTRTALPNITFARESTNDRFYIRMYDGATPPNYSEFSTALFINLPLGS